MDRVHRDRFDQLQSTAPRLAATLLALDAEILAATTAADEVGRAAQAHRIVLERTMSADDELRTAMVRMATNEAWSLLALPATAVLGSLLAGGLLGWTESNMGGGLLLGFTLGVPLLGVPCHIPVMRFRRIAKAARRRAVGVPLLPGPIPVPIVAPGRTTLDSLERYVSALEAGVTARAAFLQAERTRQSLTEAEGQRLELLLQYGIDHRAELESRYKSAQLEQDERLRKEAEQPRGDYGP